jgi:hypothetical protein
MGVEVQPLPDLVAACRVETERYLHGNPMREDACHEIIRRAVCERDEPAWQAFYDLYRGVVLAWVRRHPVSAGIEWNDDDWVTLAFERFWSSVGPERFAGFAGLAQLLQYLKLCAHSAVMDEARARRRALATSLDDAAPDGRPPTERLVIDGLVTAQLWQEVLTRTRDEAERVIAQECLGLGLKAREVQARHPTLFPTVRDVYRTDRNLSERLRRDATIRAYLQG